ncbi:hypothetical protein ACWEQG_31470 [Microbispora sp. NPDC004025]
MDERRELAEDLRRIVGGRVLGALEILFEPDELSGEDTRLRELLAVKSRAWADVLCGEDDRAAAFLAIRLVSALYPGDTPFDPPAAWWGTPLGRAVARRAGHPAATAVPVSVAAAMLGITRQGVHDLVRRHKLDRDSEGAITTASIQARLSRGRGDRAAAGTRRLE